MDYIKEMRTRFSDNDFADPMSELVSLKQFFSVEEYYNEFEALLNLLHLTDEYSLSIFVSNLKPEIAKICEVVLFENINSCLQPSQIGRVYVI